MQERIYFLLFKASLGLKAVNAGLEALGGLALATVSNATIENAVRTLTQHELRAAPNDWLAQMVLGAFQDISVSTQQFFAIYLLAHGAIKLFLIGSLWRQKSWAYPASLAVFAALIAYQLYRISFSHSLGLVALTAFDCFFVAIIWHEYRVSRRPVINNP